MNKKGDFTGEFRQKNQKKGFSMQSYVPLVMEYVEELGKVVEHWSGKIRETMFFLKKVPIEGEISLYKLNFILYSETSRKKNRELKPRREIFSPHVQVRIWVEEWA